MPSIRTNDVETYYERHGDGPPVVMAHGAGYDHRWWEPQVEALREDFELITYDLRGHGRTGGGADWHSYPPELYALDLRELIRELDLDRPVVVGHSLGGMFLPHLATTYPDTLRGMVLADAQVRSGVTLQGRVFQRVLLPFQLLVTRLLGPDRAEAVAERITEFATDESERADVDPELEAYQEDLKQYRDRTETLRLYRGLRQFEGARLEDVAVPTLGVYGGDDPPMMRRNAAELIERVPDAERVDVPGASHLLTWNEPEAFDDALRAFLERVWVADAG